MCKVVEGRKLDKYGRLVNDPKIQGECLICNKNKQMKKSELSSNGKEQYRGICQTCNNARRDYSKSEGSKYIYRQHKKNYCEECGFIPEHQCQLDVDHIDNNHDNNEESNLKTLCANCHRLKSWKHANSKVIKRKELVDNHFKEQEEFKKSLEKTVRYRRSIKGIQYSFYMKENSNELEVEKELKKQIKNGLEGILRRKKP